MIQNTEKYRVKKNLLKAIDDFLTKCELKVNVEESAKLSSFINSVLDYLSNTDVRVFETTYDVLHHKYSSDSVGTFHFFKSFAPNTKQSVLFVYDWDWKIDPYVFPNLYSLLLQKQPIYDVISTDDCGFSIVKDARGYFNHINSQKQVISKEWFQKVTPFQNINGNIFAYVRRLNGDVCFIFDNGMLGKIDDNWTRYNADALLGESRIHQIIMEVLSQYLRQNLILN